LSKLASGNMSLVDSIGSVQLAIQAAIRSSTSPEILNMFLKKEHGSLRTRLASLDSDRILGRITLDAYNSQAVDIVKMLEKLGEPLSPKEQELLRKVQLYCTWLPHDNALQIFSRRAALQDEGSLDSYHMVSGEIGKLLPLACEVRLQVSACLTTRVVLAQGMICWRQPLMR
jgi:hypothetical protein